MGKLQQAAESGVEVAEEARESSDSEVITVDMDIPCAQPSHEPETQAVMNDLMMVKKRFALKRKNSSKKDTPKKKKTVDEIIKEQDPKDDMLSMLGLIIVMWTDEFIPTAVSAMKLIVKIALNEKKFGTKKISFEMQQGISSTIESLQHLGIDVKTCSLRDFVKGLCENEFCTTFTERSMAIDESDWILDNYIEVLPEASCASLTTTTTSTSSMIVRTPTLAADVDLPSTSKSAQTSEGGILDELFPRSSSVSSIGSISQSISKRDGDIFATWSTPGECGYRVIKLDIYNFSKISGVPKERWWKQASYRSTFMTSSPVDPKEILITKLLQTAAQDLKKVPGIRKEEKTIQTSMHSVIGTH